MNQQGAECPCCQECQQKELFTGCAVITHNEWHERNEHSDHVHDHLNIFEFGLNRGHSVVSNVQIRKRIKVNDCPGHFRALARQRGVDARAF